jgi:hypothetical protein
MYTHAVVIWFAILVVAITNGAVRVDLLIPRFGQDLGHVLSTISLCVAIFAVTWASIEWIGAVTRNDAITVGLLWLAPALAAYARGLLTPNA